MSLDPGPRHRQGHGADPAPVLRAEGHGHVPGGAARRRARSSAAGCSCSTTSGARSSARPASSAPRPARSNASTWAASTPRSLPRPLGRARDLRRAPRGIRAAPLRPAGAGSGVRAVRAGRPGDGRRDPRGRRPRPARMLAILEATQAAYGYLPVAALKRISQETGAWYAMIYGTATYYAPPALRAAGRHRPGRRGRRASPPTESTYLAAPRRRARRRARRAPARRPGPDAMTDLLKTPAAWPRILLARAGRHGPDRPRRGGREPAPSKACGGPSASSGRTATIADDRGVRAARPRRRGLSRPARSGAPRRPRGAAALRRRERLRRGPGLAHRPDAARARPVRGHRGRAIAAFAIGATRRSSRSAPRTPRSSAGRARRSAPPRRPASSAPTSWAPATTCSIEVRPVQGAYMLGEETVLLKALEGKRGQPEQRPPHPATRGLFGMPTVVHNVQTLAAVAVDRPRGRGRVPRDRHGRRAGHGPRPGPHARRGTASPRSRSGPRCATSSGSAASCRPGRTIKAVLVGGPSGGLLPPDALDTPYTFGALREAGAHVGSGLGRRRRRPDRTSSSWSAC